MAVKDLTPQLRTRLSRIERMVGWFVLLATLLMLAGFAYYFYITAKRKGWFITKIPYYTYVKDGTGLHVGDPVNLMGFNVGQITEINATEAGNYWFTVNNYNVFVAFEVRAPYYGYVWTDSRVKIDSGNFLGGRVLEVTKGSTGKPTVVETKNAPIKVLDDKSSPTNRTYKLLSLADSGYYIPAAESPALTERFQQIADKLEQALPGILNLTNQISGVLQSVTNLSGHFDQVAVQLPPILTNARTITGFLTNRQGALGEWLLPTNLQLQISQTLTGATSTLHTADTNLARISDELVKNLENLAGITHNLRMQVETNDAIVTRISSAIIHADEMVQGLKHHWLLRSAFKSKETNAPPESKPSRSSTPKAGKQW